MAKRGSNKSRTDKRNPDRSVQGDSPRRVATADPIKSRVDTRPRMAGSLDRVSEAKKTIERLDRLDERKAPIDPFRDYRVRSVANSNKALSDHRAVQQRINETPSRQNVARRSDYGSLSQNQQAKKQQTEPDKKRSQEKVREDNPSCKPRPEHNRGSGGSRNFVPWCNRKR